ncbi:ABC transporter permease [Glaciibacter psychrotolerans]|uniref:Transport permease protein n=1 Tax=Glaciibacter psychrotolerans TaxID=670054 RepID=A0A7Z0J6V8_9MICO|nr:ABC transporter permease [Leifsonia psychrotolerans]NYJ20601.1 ABC-2 type transport system permease protein [Leifsonia psychrotolerans]
MSYQSELFATRELLANLTMREVKGKYRRTVFGQLWSLINPLATMLVYTIVFSFIFQARPSVGDPSGLNIYPLWLMCGLLPWLFFTRVVTGGMSSIVANAGLIKKVYFPRMHLPLAIAGSTGFTWLTEMALLAVVLSIAGSFVLPWVPLVAVFMVLLALFAVGLAMLLAIANVHFRDMQHFTAIGLQMWMYLTPIIYPIALVESAAKTHGEWVLQVYKLNPLERFVTVFRSMMYDNRWPDLNDSLVCLGWGVGMFIVGYLVFSRNEKRLAEML